MSVTNFPETFSIYPYVVVIRSKLPRASAAALSTLHAEQQQLLDNFKI